MAEQLVRLDARSNQITKLFNDNRTNMLRCAPKSTGHDNAMRIWHVCYQTIVYSGDLLACTQESLIGGVFEAIKLGITLGGPMQEGWLIPFNSRGGKVATLIVGYMGYRNIIDRAGSVIDMQPRAVHKDDEFDYWYGDQPRIIHKPKRPEPLIRADLRAVYCVANLRKGGRQLEVLETETVDAHRNRSRAKDSGPWVSDYVPMAKKTAMRVASKYLPKSNELLARAMDLDDKADRGVDQNLEIPPGTTLIDEEPTQRGPQSPIDRFKASRGIQTEQQQGQVIDAESIDAEAEENKRLDREIAEKEGQS